jgi:hypothetical protein
VWRAASIQPRSVGGLHRAEATGNVRSPTIEPEAAKQIADLDKIMRKRVVAALDKLAEDPKPPGWAEAWSPKACGGS